MSGRPRPLAVKAAVLSLSYAAPGALEAEADPLAAFYERIQRVARGAHRPPRRKS